MAARTGDPRLTIRQRPTGRAGASSRSRLRAAGRSIDLIAPGGFLLLVAFACFLWPLVYHVPPPLDGPNPVPMLRPFSPGHLLGTDPIGNDIFSQVLYGGRVSLEVGLSVTLLGMVAGGSIGVLAGYLGGIVDSLLMRVLDAFMAIPSLVLALAIAEGLGASELHIIWALAFFSVPAFARIARATTLRVREQPYVVAASLGGARSRQIIVEHIVPNVVPSLVTFGMLNIGIAIVVEGALDFLGVGIPPPTPSWGNMIALGQQYISSDPSLLLIPSAFLVATVLAFNSLGDALRVRWGVK